MSKARAEIDRRYFFGDTLIKTGEALGVFLLCLIGLTGLRFEAVPEAARVPYGLVLVLAAVAAFALAFAGRRMRRSASSLDRNG
ncbi:MAG: hypothetical protein KJS97_09020 [Alphaproteobacteria bacterium]|nr:hypothetical protein [Alphaproteobacteria bacterium]